MFSRLSVLFLSLFFAFAVFGQAANDSATQPARDPEGHQWWQNAVFYELYPRSFADSNNDGIGDLNGIDQHLDYLRWLGVDAVWLTPMFPSPQVDFGYDVSDYQNVDPKYGTLADMDKLIADGKTHQVKFILDFVVNHTSDKHPWFIESASSKTNPKRDWYVWRNGKGPGKPPNNWTSLFGGSAWQYDSRTSQYYYHYFYPQQPDLNWRNPAVKDAMFGIEAWWFKRGVAGFRLDAVDTLFEDPDLKDNPIVDHEKNAYGDPVENDINDKNLPEVHTVLRGLREVADQYNAVLIGETYTDNIAQLDEYYGGGKELQMPMDFLFTQVNKVSAPEFRRQIAAIENTSGWPVLVLSNHDLVRSYNRYGDGLHNDQIAKLMAAMQLTLRGTPIIYYGDEIGMENNDPKRREDVQDPIGRRGWPKEKGRDGERTPMQWNSSTNAGFSTVKPWNPVGPRYGTYNVESERKDPKSILNWYQQILALRHTNRALLDGSYTALNENDPNVLSYLRSYNGENVLVVLNMSSSPQTAKFDLASKGVTGATGTTLISTSAPKQVDLSAITLEPFGVWIGEVQN